MHFNLAKQMAPKKVIINVPSDDSSDSSFLESSDEDANPQPQQHLVMRGIKNINLYEKCAKVYIITCNNFM